MTVTIRALAPEAAELFRELRLEGLSQAPEAWADSLEDAAARPLACYREWLTEGRVFVAEDAGELLGLVGFAHDAGRKRSHRGRLVSMYVRANHRRQGVGTALVRAVIDHARSSVRQLHLSVGADNTPAIGLYRRLGFEVCGREPRAMIVDGRDIDEFLMVLMLDGKLPSSLTSDVANR
jgi:ribosomal protein S18 acetylase RimI-like enzyme